MMAEIPNIGRERLIAPYASPGNVTRTLARYRDRSLPPQFTPEMIQDLGIGQQEAYRTLAALTHLGFLDPENHPQPLFHGLRQLSDDEYGQLLQDRIRATYPALFATLDPATDPPERIRDHFRRYDPASQTAKQSALFMALCVESGLAERRATATGRSRSNGAGRTPPPSNRLKPLPPDFPPTPPSVDSVRLRLLEALIQKVSEVEADDRETIQWYLDKIKEFEAPTTAPSTPTEEQPSKKGREADPEE